jgi:hypothetical protein
VALGCPAKPDGLFIFLGKYRTAFLNIKYIIFLGDGLSSFHLKKEILQSRLHYANAFLIINMDYFVEFWF